MRERPPQLLPGRSAYDEARRGLWARLAGIGLVGLGLVLTALLSNPARTVALVTLAVPLIAASVVATRALLAQSQAQKRERQAGSCLSG